MRAQANSTPFIRIAFDCDDPDFDAMVLVLRLLKSTKAVAYLNGEPILWSDALQGPRMRIVALAAIPLEKEIDNRLHRKSPLVGLENARRGFCLSQGGRLR